MKSFDDVVVRASFSSSVRCAREWRSRQSFSSISIAVVRWVMISTSEVVASLLLLSDDERWFMFILATWQWFRAS